MSSLSDIAQPYVYALLEYSCSISLRNETTKDMNLLVQVLEKSSELKQFLRNPFIGKSMKKELVRKTFGEHLTESSLNFILLLIDKRRTDILETSARAYIVLAYKHASIGIANITSTIKLSSEQQQEIGWRLRDIMGKRRVKLALSVDPELLGGFTIKLGSRMIDASVRGQLKQIGKLLGV